jgi:hypothetical protein
VRTRPKEIPRIFAPFRKKELVVLPTPPPPKNSENAAKVTVVGPLPQHVFNGSWINSSRCSREPQTRIDCNATRRRRVRRTESDRNGRWGKPRNSSCDSRAFVLRKFRESLPPPLASGHQTRISVCAPRNLWNVDRLTSRNVRSGLVVEAGGTPAGSCNRMMPAGSSPDRK